LLLADLLLPEKKSNKPISKPKLQDESGNDKTALLNINRFQKYNIN